MGVDALPLVTETSAAAKSVTGSSNVKVTPKAPFTGAVYPVARAIVTPGPVPSYCTVSDCEPLPALVASSATPLKLTATVTFPVPSGVIVAV